MRNKGSIRCGALIAVGVVFGAGCAATRAPTCHCSEQAPVLMVPAALRPAKAGTGIIVGNITGGRRYLSEAVIYVKDLATAPPSSPILMNQHNQQFVPHVLPVVAGTTVLFGNEDETGHHVFSPDGDEYDLGPFHKGTTRVRKFDTEGVYTQLCRMHPSMLGYVVVVPNEYFGQTTPEGTFRIDDVPPGSYELAVWQKNGVADDVPVTVVADQITRVAVKMHKKQ